MWRNDVKADLLNIDFINNLYQPLWIRQWGDKEFLWPVYDICVLTGLIRIDVCGKLQAMHFSDIAEIKDDSGNIYEAEEFYLEQ
jgi:hypothetical protein